MKSIASILFLVLLSCGNNRSAKLSHVDTFTTRFDKSTIDTSPVDTSPVSMIDASNKHGKPIQLVFKMIGSRFDGGNRNYDVYISDINRIAEANEYLQRLDFDNLDFIEINYFDNARVAKVYFAKQESDMVSENEKDRLFTHFIACFKHNHNTGYSALSYMHR